MAIDVGVGVRCLCSWIHIWVLEDVVNNFMFRGFAVIYLWQKKGLVVWGTKCVGWFCGKWILFCNRRRRFRWNWNMMWFVWNCRGFKSSFFCSQVRLKNTGRYSLQSLPVTKIRYMSFYCLHFLSKFETSRTMTLTHPSSRSLVRNFGFQFK